MMLGTTNIKFSVHLHTHTHTHTFYIGAKIRVYILAFEVLDMCGKTKDGEIDNAEILMIVILP